jgi:hypothetical protein
LAMPAMLLTIDMRPVYDGFREGSTMQTRTWAAVFLFGLGVGAAMAQTPSQAQPQPMPMDCKCPMSGMNMDHGKDMNHGKSMEHNMVMAPAGALKITFGDKSAAWTPATLAALPHKTLTVYDLHTKANQTYTGVPLMDLLTRLGVPDKQHGKDLRLYLVAEGTDGFEAVYSVAEVNPDVHDATVIVADTMDGKPLTVSGPLQLVAPGEKRPARWVRNLVAIRVLATE